jgi:membrane-associated phospholipid phosphatase
MRRAGVRILLALVALHAAGALVVALFTRGPLLASLAALDARGTLELTGRFEPAFAPGLLASVGPQGAVYPILAAVTLLAALISRWRTVPLAALSLALCLAFGAEIWLLASHAISRAGPLAALPDLPVPPDWRVYWQDGGSFPSRHALFAAALGATLARTWLPLAVIGYPVALLCAATPVFFGAAWASDAVAGLVLGVLVAEAARFIARQLLYLAVRAPRALRGRPAPPLAVPQTGVLRSYSRAS